MAAKNMELQAKEKVCNTVKGQVDNLVSELEKMQSSVVKKEKGL